jgi:hypothetical protein
MAVGPLNWDAGILKIMDYFSLDVCQKRKRNGRYPFTLHYS